MYSLYSSVALDLSGYLAISFHHSFASTIPDFWGQSIFFAALRFTVGDKFYGVYLSADVYGFLPCSVIYVTF